MNSISLTANNFAVIDVTNFSQSTQLVFAALVALGGAAVMMGMINWNSKRQGRIIPKVDLNAQTVPSPSGVPNARVSAACVNGLRDCRFEDARTLYESFHRGARVSNNGPALGYRAPGPGTRNPYVWMSFNTAIARSEALAGALVDVGLAIGQTTCVGIYSKNRPEWVLMEQACFAYDMITVPLYDTLGEEACHFIIEQTQIHLILVDECEKAIKLLSTKNLSKRLQFLVVIDECTDKLRELSSAKDVKVYTFEQFENHGAQLHKRAQLTPPKADSVCTICYTSGTTGMPKGAVLTHRNVVSVCSALATVNTSIGPGDIYLSFLPLAHMFERLVECGTFSHGGAVGFYSGDIRQLTDDFMDMRPTLAAVVPRVLNRIYATVMAQAATSVIKHRMIAWALHSKTDDLNHSIVRHDGIWDRLVFGKVRAKLGGRLRLVFTGAAPISAEVLTFTRAAFGCVVLEGYGQTECAAACTLTVEGDHVAGSVGVPVPSVEIRLVDVPDLEYYAADNKGEVCVRGFSVFSGYHNDTEKTAEALDKDGWLHTGDIGQWTERGTLRIIDRKKQLMKLAQGEYVSPEKIETVYAHCPLVTQVFVHGDSLKASLVAVVVPDLEALRKLAIRNDVPKITSDTTLSILCSNDAVKKLVLDELIKLGKAKHLLSFEQVRDIHLSPIAFTVENDLLTPTLKSKRPQLILAYKQQLKDMNDNID